MLILLSLGVGFLTDEERETLRKVSEYLEEHKFPYMVQANREYESTISLSDVVAEMDADDFKEFCSFATEKLGIKPSSMHIAYQVSCIRLDGERTWKEFPIFPLSLEELERRLKGL